jgi:putative NIF3 family GTP cyclohydrolase 1 type 2
VIRGDDPPGLDALRAAIDAELDADRFADLDDPNGIWRQRAGPIRAVGLVLESWSGIAAWVADERLEALVIHRPWALPEGLPGDPGVLAYHLAFDERLTIGLNSRLAAALPLRGMKPLGEKAGRPIGMIGDVDQVRLAAFGAALERTLGTTVELHGDVERIVRRAAVVGAMWPSVVEDASHDGADVYVTGTLRPSALEAVAETGIAVAVVGHHAPERWGLRALASSIASAFPSMRVAVRE